MSKVLISQKTTLNKIEIWNHIDTGQLKCKVEFSPSKSAVKKINSPCKHKNYEKLFEHEINNTSQSLCKNGNNGIELYHSSKAEVTKRFNSITSLKLPHV